MTQERSERSDRLRMRQRLLDALAGILETDGLGFTMPQLARVAGVSTATVYRHFDDLEELRSEFYNRIFESVIAEMTRLSVEHEGMELFRALCRAWVELELPWARAATVIRSPEGIIERVHRGDQLSSAYHGLVSAAVSELIDIGEVPQQSLDFAALMWMTIFDERVFVDMTGPMSLSAQETSERLGDAVLAVLRRDRES